MAATLYEPAFATVTRPGSSGTGRGRCCCVTSSPASPARSSCRSRPGWSSALGWRAALVALAVILAVLTIPPHALLLRRRPEDLGLLPDGDERPEQPARAGRVQSRDGVELREALRDPAFWWLTRRLLPRNAVGGRGGVHLIPYLTERGDGAGFAAAATGLIGAAQVAARVVGDRIRRPAVAGRADRAGLRVAGGRALVSCWGGGRRPGCWRRCCCSARAAGAVTLMRAGLVAEFYGRAHYGAISGTLALFVYRGAGAAPVGAGLAYALGGGYGPVFLGLAGASLLAATAMVGVPGWRR